MSSANTQELLQTSGANNTDAVQTGVTGGEVEPIADATETAAMIQRGDITALEAVEAAISRAEALQPKLNFLVSSCFDQARERAKAPELSGPFAGVPYLIKDMVDYAGQVTRMGSNATRNFPPAKASIPYVQAVENLGVVVIGKTTLGEFGLLPTTEPLAFGPTRNPWNTNVSTSGSSGGAGAAVAAGIVPFADGSDGGGSIRHPASACGLFGLKPSQGRLVGPTPVSGPIDITVKHCLTRSVRDSATMFAATERTGDDAVHPPIGKIEGPANRRLKIGFVNGGVTGNKAHPDVQRGMDDTCRLLQELGHHVEETSWAIDGEVLTRDFIDCYAKAVAEGTEMFRQLTGVEPNTTMFETTTLGLREMGLKLTSDDIAALLERRQANMVIYEAWLKQFDLILSPVFLTPPIPLGEITGDLSADEALDRTVHFINGAYLQNYIGAPAASIPLHWTEDNLPVGMQFAAGMGQERTLFELGFELEAAKPWAHRRPPVFA
ncbi:amidase family protein [Phyllobacterium sp. TAF24]|uniref:amidase family protein n=1 Tax=Phyllobacterium sp. TAF24 TaxID=3233068 RepID=UPI003F982C25